MIVWCRRCSISPTVTSTGWGLCHASSLSVLCVRGHLSPLMKLPTIRHAMISPINHVSSLTVLHIITVFNSPTGMSILSLSIFRRHNLYARRDVALSLSLDAGSRDQRRDEEQPRESLGVAARSLLTLSSSRPMSN